MHAKIGLLRRCAVRLALSSREPSHDAVLMLLTAATVSAIRNVPSGAGIAPNLRELMLEAMQIARDITSPLACQAEFQGDGPFFGLADGEMVRS